MSNILILYHFPPVVAGTSVDHLDAFSKYSKHNVLVIDSLTATHTVCCHTIPKIIDLNWFDVLVIHYSIYMPSEYMIDNDTRHRIRNFRGRKIAFIQDEYRQVNKIHHCLNDLAIDVLFTCVPTEEVEKVYPVSTLPRLQKINTLTGYVPEQLSLKRLERKIADRSIDVGYRARKLSAWYGELAQEKIRIGEGFLEHNACLATGLKCDISCDEDKRIYGESWIEFIQSCRCMLGVESGASVFDFTGKIQAAVERFEGENPNVSFCEIKELFFKDLDGKIYLNQISPRCFEAIALKTPLILFKGEYSGILIPWRHYVPLEKDFSNFMDVVRYVRDDEFLQNLAESAYRDIVATERYSYREFIREFDAEIAPHLVRESTNSFLLLNQALLNCFILLEIQRCWVRYVVHRILHRPHLALYGIAKRAYRFAPNSIKHSLMPVIAKIRSMVFKSVI